MTKLSTLMAVVLAAALTTAGCTTGDDARTQAPTTKTAEPRGSNLPAPRFQRYVAIGDSYTSAPYVPLTDLAGGCLRSSGNYPTLLATRLRSELRDVSCSGAETADVASRQRVIRNKTAPPQIRAVNRRTDLVTISLGGNDFGLFGNVARTCPIVGPRGTPRRKPVPGVSCGYVSAMQLASVREVGPRLEAVIRLVRKRAPQAKIVVVGYPRAVDSGKRSCTKLPVSDANAARLDGLLQRLRAAMSQAAANTSVTFVDVYRASAGHGVCSRRPWVNGIFTDTEAAAALHPLPAGQRAVARLIERALD